MQWLPSVVFVHQGPHFHMQVKHTMLHVLPQTTQEKKCCLRKVLFSQAETMASGLAKVCHPSFALAELKWLFFRGQINHTTHLQVCIGTQQQPHLDQHYSKVWGVQSAQLCFTSALHRCFTHDNHSKLHDVISRHSKTMLQMWQMYFCHLLLPCADFRLLASIKARDRTTKM